MTAAPCQSAQATPDEILRLVLYHVPPQKFYKVANLSACWSQRLYQVDVSRWLQHLTAASRGAHGILVKQFGAHSPRWLAVMGPGNDSDLSQEVRCNTLDETIADYSDADHSGALDPIALAACARVNVGGYGGESIVLTAMRR